MEFFVFLILLVALDVAAARWGADTRTYERNWQ
jgi:hypothetical protein